MHITLSQDQYEKLLHLVFLGNWLVNSYRGDERLEEYDKLAEDIIQNGGCLISEFEPDFKATLWSFPRRNRLLWIPSKYEAPVPII